MKYLQERLQGKHGHPLEKKPTQKRVKDIVTQLVEKHPPRPAILDSKTKCIKYENTIIVFGKLINRQKIGRNVRTCKIL